MNCLHFNIYALFIFCIFFKFTFSGCAYTVNSSLLPEPTTDPTPQNMTFLQVCQQYMGQLGCCNPYTQIVQKSSYGKLDVVFGNSNGGCDICVVNLKRFWCQYACSARQDQFMVVGDYVTIPNPQKLGTNITVQNITLRVESSTSCALYQSCSRTSYAAQLSAMQSPAGFLIFQGSNAMDDGAQLINIKFTNNKQDGLYLSDLDKCGLNITSDTLHGFPVTGNCTCNACSEKCEKFIYEPPKALQGFNFKLVGITWGCVIVITSIITFYRIYSQRKAKSG